MNQAGETYFTEYERQSVASDKPSAQIEEVQYHARLGLFPYVLTIAPADLPVLKECKKTVEDIFGHVKAFLRGEVRPSPVQIKSRLLSPKRISLILGDSPGDEDVLLFSISTFVQSNYMGTMLDRAIENIAWREI